MVVGIPGEKLVRISDWSVSCAKFTLASGLLCHKKILHSIYLIPSGSLIFTKPFGWNILETHFPRSNFRYKLEGGKLHPPNKNQLILCTKYTICSHLACKFMVKWCKMYSQYSSPNHVFPFSFQFQLPFFKEIQLRYWVVHRFFQADEPAVVMHTAGGRRKRLGVGGRARRLSDVTH